MQQSPRPFVVTVSKYDRSMLLIESGISKGIWYAVGL